MLKWKKIQTFATYGYKESHVKIVSKYSCGGEVPTPYVSGPIISSAGPALLLNERFLISLEHLTWVYWAHSTSFVLSMPDKKVFRDKDL